MHADTHLLRLHPQPRREPPLECLILCQGSCHLPHAECHVGGRQSHLGAPSQAIEVQEELSRLVMASIGLGSHGVCLITQKVMHSIAEMEHEEM